MTLSKIKTLVRKKEERYPRLVRTARKMARAVSGPRTEHPRTLGREIAAVSDVLQTPFWNMNYGKNLVHEKLEREWAEYVGVANAVAVNTGGMAIQMALRALGVKPGDEVIHQIDTCVADAFAIIAAGGTPIFADINTNSFMLSGDSLESEVTPQTRVITAIHMWGNPEDVDLCISTAKRHDLFFLEDACLALGAKRNGRMAGSFGDAAVFSLGCLKPIQAGEGGIITTSDDALARELRTIRNWGDMTGEYGVRDQKVLSWNGRISEIVAAVALEQLRGYPVHLAKLLEMVEEFAAYIQTVDGLEVAVPRTEQIEPAYTQFVVKIKEQSLGISKSGLLTKLRAAGVPVGHANFEPINHLSFFREGLWRDWILKGNQDRINRNYAQQFHNSEEAYYKIGVGFSRENFASRKTVRNLINTLDRVLSSKGK